VVFLPTLFSGVYPRLRGGTQCEWQGLSQGMGLSPLARGNRGNALGKVHQLGSIPACAGEPPFGYFKAEPFGVYPRLRGGTHSWPHCGHWRTGLSPLARGNHLCGRFCGSVTGSIPACAGEPRTVHEDLRLAGVYPRLRGGTGIEAASVAWHPGLSPLARGNPQRILLPVVAVGSIPACAGEPRGILPAHVPAGVYPRLRGGTGGVYRHSPICQGLSPLARGNLQRRSCQSVPSGSIPACAGEPLIGGVLSHAIGVYPRLRGGTRRLSFQCAYHLGLSPLARGNPRQPG